MLRQFFQKFSSLTSTKHHILFVDCDFPRPLHDAGSVETLAILDSLLSLGFDISFLALGRFFQSPDERARTPDTALTARHIRCLSPAGDTPPTEHTGIQNDLTSTTQISACIIARSCCGGAFIDLLKTHYPNAKFIFLPHDLHFLREEREASTSPQTSATLTPHETKKRETQLLQRCDATLFFSQHEVSIGQNLAPNACLRYIPLTRPCAISASLTNRRDIGFIGNFAHRPNADAVFFFLSKIWPSLHAQHPELMFHIIGENPPAELSTNAHPNLQIHGHIPDLDAFLKTLRLTVAPLRFGAGAKGKVVSSLATGVPCVMTDIAAEGMAFPAVLNQHCIAATPEIFIQQCLSLLNNDPLWHDISLHSTAMISKSHSPDVLRTTLADLFQTLGLKRNHQR